MQPQLNLLVIRTTQLEAVKQQYELLGFKFDYHQHGKGPFHYAAEVGHLVFEIYPTQNIQETNTQIRLGFSVSSLSETFSLLEQSTWKVIHRPKQTEWGLVAVIEDLDGRKVELSECK